MAEYIRLISMDNLLGYCVKHKCASVPIDFIKAEKPIIAANVKCGKWKISSDGYYYYCSECQYVPNGGLTNFCPDCGADMRGSEIDG